MVDLSIPDKLSVATYLVQYYNCFKDKSPSSSKGGAPLPTSRQPATPAVEVTPLSNKNKNKLQTGSVSQPPLTGQGSPRHSNATPTISTKTVSSPNLHTKDPTNFNLKSDSSPKLRANQIADGSPQVNGSPNLLKTRASSGKPRSDSNVLKLIGAIETKQSTSANKTSKASIPSKPPPPISITSVAAKASGDSQPAKLNAAEKLLDGTVPVSLRTLSEEPPSKAEEPAQVQGKESSPAPPPAPVTQLTATSKKKTRRSRKSKFAPTDPTNSNSVSDDKEKSGVGGSNTKQEANSAGASNATKEDKVVGCTDTKQGTEVAATSDLKQAPPKQPDVKQEAKVEVVSSRVEMRPSGTSGSNQGRQEKPKGYQHPRGVALSSAGNRHGNTKRGTMGMEKCEECGERVFLMERLGVENRVFHRACFKCSTCHCKLKAGSYEYDAHTDMFYCRQHYREALRSQTINRAMAERGLTLEQANLKQRKSPEQDNKVNGRKEDVEEKHGKNAHKDGTPPPKPAKATATVSATVAVRPSPPPPYSRTEGPAQLPPSTVAYLTKGKQIATTSTVQQPTSLEGQGGGATTRDSDSPVKPPRRKKHMGGEAAAAPEGELQPDKPVKQESIRPKRVAPPRPSHPPSLRSQGLSQGI